MKSDQLLKIADATMKVIENATTMAKRCRIEKRGFVRVSSFVMIEGRGAAEAKGGEHYAAFLTRMLSIRGKSNDEAESSRHGADKADLHRFTARIAARLAPQPKGAESGESGTQEIRNRRGEAPLWPTMKACRRGAVLPNGRMPAEPDTAGTEDCATVRGFGDALGRGESCRNERA